MDYCSHLFMIAIVYPAYELCPAHGFHSRRPRPPPVSLGQVFRRMTRLFFVLVYLGYLGQAFSLQPCPWLALPISCDFGKDLIFTEDLHDCMNLLHNATSMISARRTLLGSGFFQATNYRQRCRVDVVQPHSLSSPLGPRVYCSLHDIFLHLITRPIYGGTISTITAIHRPDKRSFVFWSFGLFANTDKIQSAIRPKLKSMVRLQPVLSKPNGQSRRPHNP